MSVKQAGNYIAGFGTVTSVNNTSPDSNGNVTLSIPTVNDATLTITQAGTTKGTFTANASNDVTIALDAGGAWGSITGTLSNQTDLQTALNGKADVDLSNLSSTASSNLDGQWVSDRLVIATGVAYTTTHTSYSLSTYLPNDNYQYEVLFQVGNTNTQAVSIETDLGFSTGVRSASTSVQLYNSFTLPVGTGRTIEAYTTSGTSSRSVIVAIGYRRIGTNS